MEKSLNELLSIQTYMQENGISANVLKGMAIFIKLSCQNFSPEIEDVDKAKFIEACTFYIQCTFAHHNIDESQSTSTLIDYLRVLHNVFKITEIAPDILKKLVLEVIDNVLDPSTIFSTVSHMLVKYMNEILMTCGKDCKSSLASIENFHFMKLMDRVLVTGDFDMQSAIVELLFHLCPKINDIQDNMFPSSPILQEALTSVRKDHFDHDIRYFLNAVNKFGRSVVSVKADVAFAGKIKIIPPTQFCEATRSELWVDFNKHSHCISIQCAARCLSKSNNIDEDETDVLIIKKVAVEKMSLKKSKRDNKPAGLQIKLNCPPKVNLDTSVEMVANCRRIELTISDGVDEVEEILKIIFPEIFQQVHSNSESMVVPLNLNLLDTRTTCRTIGSNLPSIYSERSLTEDLLALAEPVHSTVLQSKSPPVVTTSDSSKFETCRESTNPQEQVASSYSEFIGDPTSNLIAESDRVLQSTLDGWKEDDYSDIAGTLKQLRQTADEARMFEISTQQPVQKKELVASKLVPPLKPTKRIVRNQTSQLGSISEEEELAYKAFYSPISQVDRSRIVSSTPSCEMAYIAKDLNDNDSSQSDIFKDVEYDIRISKEVSGCNSSMDMLYDTKDNELSERVLISKEFQCGQVEAMCYASTPNKHDRFLVAQNFDENYFISPVLGRNKRNRKGLKGASDEVVDDTTEKDSNASNAGGKKRRFNGAIKSSKLNFEIEKSRNASRDDLKPTNEIDDKSEDTTLINKTATSTKVHKGVVEIEAMDDVRVETTLPTKATNSEVIINKSVDTDGIILTSVNVDHNAKANTSKSKTSQSSQNMVCEGSSIDKSRVKNKTSKTSELDTILIEDEPAKSTEDIVFEPKKKTERATKPTEVTVSDTYKIRKTTKPSKEIVPDTKKTKNSTKSSEEIDTTNTIETTQSEEVLVSDTNKPRKTTESTKEIDPGSQKAKKITKDKGNTTDCISEPDNNVTAEDFNKTTRLATASENNITQLKSKDKPKIDRKDKSKPKRDVSEEEAITTNFYIIESTNKVIFTDDAPKEVLQKTKGQKKAKRVVDKEVVESQTVIPTKTALKTKQPGSISKKRTKAKRNRMEDISYDETNEVECDENSSTVLNVPKSPTHHLKKKKSFEINVNKKSKTTSNIVMSPTIADDHRDAFDNNAQLFDVNTDDIFKITNDAQTDLFPDDQLESHVHNKAGDNKELHYGAQMNEFIDGQMGQYNQIEANDDLDSSIDDQVATASDPEVICIEDQYASTRAKVTRPNKIDEHQNTTNRDQMTSSIDDQIESCVHGEMDRTTNDQIEPTIEDQNRAQTVSSDHNTQEYSEASLNLRVETDGSKTNSSHHESTPKIKSNQGALRETFEVNSKQIKNLASKNDAPSDLEQKDTASSDSSKVSLRTNINKKFCKVTKVTPLKFYTEYKSAVNKKVDANDLEVENIFNTSTQKINETSNNPISTNCNDKTDIEMNNEVDMVIRAPSEIPSENSPTPLHQLLAAELFADQRDEVVSVPASVSSAWSDVSDCLSIKTYVELVNTAAMPTIEESPVKEEFCYDLVEEDFKPLRKAVQGVKRKLVETKVMPTRQVMDDDEEDLVVKREETKVVPTITEVLEDDIPLSQLARNMKKVGGKEKIEMQPRPIMRRVIKRRRHWYLLGEGCSDELPVNTTATEDIGIVADTLKNEKVVAKNKDLKNQLSVQDMNVTDNKKFEGSKDESSNKITMDEQQLNGKLSDVPIEGNTKDKRKCDEDAESDSDEEAANKHFEDIMKRGSVVTVNLERMDDVILKTVDSEMGQPVEKRRKTEETIKGKTVASSPVTFGPKKVKTLNVDEKDEIDLVENVDRKATKVNTLKGRKTDKKEQIGKGVAPELFPELLGLQEVIATRSDENVELDLIENDDVELVQKKGRKEDTSKGKKVKSSALLGLQKLATTSVHDDVDLIENDAVELAEKNAKKGGLRKGKKEGAPKSKKERAPKGKKEGAPKDKKKGATKVKRVNHSPVLKVTTTSIDEDDKFDLIEKDDPELVGGPKKRGRKQITTQAVLNSTGRPIKSTHANFFGHASPIKHFKKSKLQDINATAVDTDQSHEEELVDVTFQFEQNDSTRQTSMERSKPQTTFDAFDSILNTQDRENMQKRPQTEQRRTIPNESLQDFFNSMFSNVHKNQDKRRPNFFKSSKPQEKNHSNFFKNFKKGTTSRHSHREEGLGQKITILQDVRIQPNQSHDEDTKLLRKIVHLCRCIDKKVTVFLESRNS